MKKLKLTVSFLGICFVSFAQLKVKPDGRVGIGGETSPNAQTKLHVGGNVLASVDTNSIVSAPFIKATNNYTSLSTPDYTWYGDTHTGMYHPALYAMGFTVRDTTKIYLTSKDIRFTGNSTFSNDLSGITSAARIRGLNSYSTVTTPDYTWWGNDQTGFYHPATNQIGLTVAGSQKALFTSTDITLTGNLVNTGTVRATGNVTFSSSATPTSAALIKATTAYSTASLPDYTWYGNTTTGFYHPAANQVGLTINGSQKALFGASTIALSGNLTQTGTFRTTGDATFSSSATPTSAPLIKAVIGYSTASLPDYTWCGNTTTGIYHPASNQMGISVSGTERVLFQSNLTTISTDLRTYGNSTFYRTGGSPTESVPKIVPSNGTSTASTPEYTWSGDSNTGIYHPADNVFGIVANGTNMFTATDDSVAIFNGHWTKGFSMKDTIFGGQGVATFYPNKNWHAILGTENRHFGGAYIDHLLYTLQTNISDERLKKNIRELTSGISIVKQLNPVRFQYNESLFGADTELSKNKNIAINGDRIGFLAQDIQKILPELVHEQGQGYLGIDVEGLIPVLTQAIKEQQVQIEALQYQVQTLREIQPSAKREGVDVSNIAQVTHLEQNTPNPFTQQTTVRYFISEQASSAEIMIFDMAGTLLRTYPNLAKGEGEINISAGELVAGMYLYSLIVNGAEIDSKRMILTR